MFGFACGLSLNCLGMVCIDLCLSLIVYCLWLHLDLVDLNVVCCRGSDFELVVVLVFVGVIWVCLFVD